MVPVETMTCERLPHDSPSAAPKDAPTDGNHPAVYTSEELLQGRREAWIEHGDQMYRLRLTQAGKLYLTK